MPVLGNSPYAVTGIHKRGIFIPAGSLDNWRTARDAVKAGTATTSLDVSIFGDSTTYGASTAVYGGLANYSWIERLRANAIAAGWPDGGYGLANMNDSYTGYNANGQGDAPTLSLAGTSWTNTPDALTQGGFRSNTAGDVATITLKNCRYARFYYMKGQTSGVITYQFQGAAAVTVDAYRTGTVAYDVVPVWYDFGSTGNWTVTVTNGGDSPTSAGTTTGCEFAVEAIKATPGVVFHRNAVSGATVTGFFEWRGDLQATQDPWNQICCGLQSYAGGNSVNGYPWGAPPGAKPTYRNAKLAIMQIGTNDIGGNVVVDGSSTTALNSLVEGLHHFIRTVRAAGGDPVVVAPPYDTSVDPGASTYSARVLAQTLALCQATGSVFVNFAEAVGPVNTWQAKNYGGGNIAGPHLGAPGYQAEADFLWNNVLTI